MTRAVRVGDVTIGGGADPVLQSMTSTPTHDTAATREQITRLQERGARLVRIALPDQQSLRALPALRAALGHCLCAIPLIGDIHFSLSMAFQALQWVEKVRVNPGNLLEAPRSRATSETSSGDLGPLKALFARASGLERAVRVGVNQGSLARRIVETRGIGADAMVASALEYVQVAEDAKFKDLVVSLKSSDPWAVVEANLQLASSCPDVPLHVGVTEAGFGLQGRARSAVGVGLLLRYGIADTIRVSLAEPPEQELPVAAALIDAARPLLPPGCRLRSWAVEGVQVADQTPEQVYGRVRVPGDGGAVIHGGGVPGVTMPVVLHGVPPQARPPGLKLLRVEDSPDNPGALAAILEAGLQTPGWLDDVAEVQLTLPGRGWGGADALAETLAKVAVPLVWEAHPRSERDLMLAMVDLAQLAEAGALQRLELHLSRGPAEDHAAALDILQGMGTGSWCADIIACPQCGRCRIDVPALASEVRRRMGRRPGVKVAVMGCIVNGPGEMQDADLGCVGEGEGKVALYWRGTPIAHGVPLESAADRLEEMLRMLPASAPRAGAAPRSRRST